MQRYGFILKLLLFTVLSIFCAIQGSATSNLNWHSDMEKARQLAADNNKYLLLDFTGSDWCPWCIKLDDKVFSTPEFAEFAAEKLVLVKIDFPKKKQLSQKQALANQKLAQKYAVRGFPTVIILNSRGERVGTTGYRRGSVNNYIEHLKGMME